MGLSLGDLPKREVDLEELQRKKIAVDAYNTIHQFLSIIRQRDGTPLKDSKGRVTSHLSGLFYRITNVLEAGVLPAFVFDGKPPKWKMKTREKRKERKQAAQKKWEEPTKEGDKKKAKKYAQRTSRITPEILDSSKKLIEAMGMPWIQAPSEGEAQAAFMNREGDVYATASQDADSLLFGTPILLKNLTIAGRRKLPGKQSYVQVNPEVIKLEDVLDHFGLTRKQLIIMGTLIGTDYNPKGISGLGPKRSLKLVKNKKELDKIMKEIEWSYEMEPAELVDFFMDPPTSKDYKLEWSRPNEEKLKKLLIDEHEFSEDRIQKVIDRINKAETDRKSSLDNWFK